jgi:glycosyltransferase involved in cell wall biosynthesis
VTAGATRPTIAVVVKGYPRLSETFVAQELLALEQRGYRLVIWSLRQPTDKHVHPMHRQILAPVLYLPEYLHFEPLRVVRGLAHAVLRPGFLPLMKLFLKDVWRDRTRNRIRRLGQALVLARELDPGIAHLYAHFLHTPTSVARYAAVLTARSFSFSAHAVDIWTTPDWEKREKISDARFGVTCTAVGAAHLRDVAGLSDGDKISLVYHGLDLSRFPPPPSRQSSRDGSLAEDPVILLSVGRAVDKKGYPDLLTALAGLMHLNWTFVHVGSGPQRDALKAQAEQLGIAGRIRWLGGLPQDEVVAEMRRADVFVLAAREGEGGDRDGLPNVLMEAATQALPIISTRFAAIPEFITHDLDGLLVPPSDPDALRGALATLMTAPRDRARLGAAALVRVRTAFSFSAGINTLDQRLRTASGIQTCDLEPVTAATADP